MANRIGRAVLEIATEGAQAILADLDKVRGGIKSVGKEAAESGSRDLSGYDKALGSVNSALGGFATKLGIAGVALGAVNLLQEWTTAAIEQADAVTNLANRYQISTDAVQEFTFIAKESGVEFGTLANSARNLSRFVAEGKDSAAGALRQLGLSFADLKGLSPDEMFFKVSERLAEVTDEGTQTSLAMDLFGKAGTDALGAINQGLDEMREKAPKAHAATIAALDDLGDAWSEFMAGQRKDFSEWLGLWAVLITEGPGKTLDVYEEMSGRVPPKIKDITASLVAQHDAGGKVAMTEREMDRISKELTTSIEKKTKANDAWVDSLNKLTGADALKDAADALRLLSAAGGPAGVLPSQLKGLADTFNRAADAAEKFGNPKRAQEYRLLAQTLSPVVQFQQKWNVTIGEFVTLNRDYTDAILEQNSLYTETGDILHFGVLPNLFDWKKSLEDHEFIRAHRTEVEKLDRTYDAFGEGLKGLSQAFAQISQVMGDTKFGRITQEIADLVTGMDLAFRAGRTFRDGLKEIKEESGGLGDKLALGAVSFGSFAAGMIQLTQSTNSAQASLSAFTQTASLAMGLGASGAAATGFGLAAAGVMYGISVHNARREWRELRAEMEKQIGRINKSISDLLEGTSDIGAAFAALGLDIQDTFDPDVERRLEKTAEFFTELQKRLGEVNEEFAPLLQSATQLGQRLDASVLMALERLRELGLLSKENAALLDQLQGAPLFSTQKAEEAAGRLGIRLTSLGKTFEQAKLHEQARQLINDFTFLTDVVGVDMGTALSESKDKFSEMVQLALRSGGKLPENVKAWVTELQRAGLLVDANGEAYSDAQLEALQWGDRIQTDAEKTNEALKNLTDTLLKLAEAISSLPTIPTGPGTTGPGTTPPGGTPGGGGEDDHGRRVGSYGKTGNYLEDFENGTWMLLHGLEGVVTKAQIPGLAMAAALGRIPGIPPIKLPTFDLPPTNFARPRDPVDVRVRLDDPGSDRFSKQPVGGGERISIEQFIVPDYREPREFADFVIANLGNDITSDRMGVQVQLRPFIEAVAEDVVRRRLR